MRDRDDRLIAEGMYSEASLPFGLSDVGTDIVQHLNVADQLYQALTVERDPSQITDDDIDNVVLGWVDKQQWIPASFSSGMSEYLGQNLKRLRDEQTAGTEGSVDEAGDPVSQQPKRRASADPEWRKRGSIKKKYDKRNDQLARDRRRRGVHGAPNWYKNKPE